MKSVKLSSFRLISFVLPALWLIPSLVLAQKEKADIVFDSRNETFSFTASEMKTSLEKAGFTVTLAEFRKLPVKSTVKESTLATFYMNDVTDLGVSMDKPVGNTVLEIRSVKLSNDEKPKTSVGVSGQ